MLPLRTQLAAVLAIAAMLPQAGLAATDCRMRDALATMKKEQCDFCKDATDSVCQGGGVGSAAEAVHTHCDWTLAHGCRASKRISHFSELLSESKSFASAKKLLDLGKECSLHLGKAECGNASLCQWEDGVVDQGADVDFIRKLQASGTTSNCMLQDNVFFLLLLSVVDGSTQADVDHFLDSAKVCQAASEAACPALNDDFIATGDYGKQLPCEVSDNKCVLSLNLLMLKIAEISEEPKYIKTMEDSMRCRAVKKGDDCTLSKVTGCAANGDGECELPESAMRGYGSVVLNSFFNKKDTCDAVTSKTNCDQGQAQYGCVWNVEDNECSVPQDMHGVGFEINHASGEKLGWVEDFMKGFDQCENVMDGCATASDCYDKCTAAGCEWMPGVTCGKDGTGCGPALGSGDLKGACGPHLGGVIPLAISDQKVCATALSDAIHVAIACETHTVEADCTGNRNHPDYKCDWNCGMCIPAEQYFPISAASENTTTTTGPTSAGVVAATSAVLATAMAMVAITL